MRRWALIALGSLTLAALGLIGCATEEAVDPAAEQAAADLTWLKENKPVLDAKREELRGIRDQLAGNVPAAEPAEGEEAPTPEELEGRVRALEAEIETLAQQVGERVVSYLNNANISVGAELTPDQKFGIDVKIDEDMAIAQEYIDRGGDYSRALDIYKQALTLDPSHEDLNAAIAEAEEMRWMTEERFAQVKKGMTQNEVRSLLGQVMPSNLRDYPDRGVVGWFYKKEDGGAAAVYFREKRKGQGNWQVYDMNYNAIEQKVVEGDG